jgi:hypothetical protein
MKVQGQVNGTVTKPTANEKDLSALEQMHRVRVGFRSKICEVSYDKSEAVLCELRSDGMFDFAEFFYTIDAMNLKAIDDISILADLHNRRIEKIVDDPDTLRDRKLNRDRVLSAIFTSDTRPRLEEIWHESPGSLDQSNLARFLMPQMSSETSRKLILACQDAGFLSRRKTAYGSIVVKSSGIMERVFQTCIREMRLSIAAL